MQEASQEIPPSQEMDSPAKARRREQFGSRKRSSVTTGQVAREGSDLLCDTWQLSNKQRLLCGFIGLAFVVPYTGLCLTYPEWTGHVGHRLSLGLFSFLGQGAIVVPFTISYFVLSCAGLRPLRKTRYAFAIPLVIALDLMVERWSHTGGWLGRVLDNSVTTAVGPGGAWLFTATLVTLLTLAFVPKAWSEMMNGVDMGQEYVREWLLRWKERLAHPDEESFEDSAVLENAPAYTNRLQPAVETRKLPVVDSVSRDLLNGREHPFLSVEEPSAEAATLAFPTDEYQTRAPRAVQVEDSFDQDELPEFAELPPPPAPPRMRDLSELEATPTRHLEPLIDEDDLAPGSGSVDLPDGIAYRAPAPPAASQVGGVTQSTSPSTLLGELAGAARASSPSAAETKPLAAVPTTRIKDDPRAAVPRALPFELPPLALLDDVPPSARRPRSEDKSQALLDALDAFGVKAKLLQIVRGPTVTRYELLPARGVKVSKFTSLTNDIALALASTAVRIEAPIPGKSAIGIEIPNDVTDLVVIKDILRDTTFTDSKGLTVALGKDLSGRPVCTDLQKMPHLLVAGTTGSGKSVCVNGLILSLLYRFTPDQLQLMMVDPKQVELSVYEDIPHLVGFSEGGKGEIIVDPKKAAMALHQVVELMEQRYTLFAECRVRNLAEYNDKAEAPMPWFVVIIDELADLMMVASKSVETSICRIAQKARAAGIHLVLATQRPSADVITGLIKVNIPSRCAFAVSSQVDSRVILDSGGAEQLLGKGDMLFLPVDASDPKRLQGAYVNNEEITRVVEFWKGQHLPENRIEFELKDDPLACEEEETDEGSDDALLEEALRAILNRDQASASMLQTDLKVGYARARRLLMAMEKKGWVSPAEGSKPRKILFSGNLSESMAEAGE